MQITLNVDDKKAAFFLELLQNFGDFVSIESSNQPHAISDAHKEILDARLASYEGNPNNLLDWETVENELEASL